MTIGKATMTIGVTGHTDSVTYNGEEQKVEGYDLSCTDALYDASKVIFSGKEAKAAGTNASETAYAMGLTASQFSYNDANITATFNVTDGSLTINPIEEEYVINITGTSDTATYDGRTHSVNGYTVGDHDATIVIEGPAEDAAVATASGITATTHTDRKSVV